MKKSEIFSRVMTAVCNATELTESEIMSPSRCEEIIDARMLFVFFCAKEGLYPRNIAKYLGKTTRAINYILSSYHNRLLMSENQLGFFAAEIRKELGNNS